MKNALGDCVFDTCMDVEAGGDGKDVACGILEGFENFMEEKYNMLVPEWRMPDRCGMFLFLDFEFESVNENNI